MERLLGKSPLRLVAERTHLFDHTWLEKLKCGHEVQTFQQFTWEDGGFESMRSTAREKTSRCGADATLIRTTIGLL
jgi:hypothetical protein